MLKYATTRTYRRIDEVLVEKETESSVWINGARRSKKGIVSFHDTWEDAHSYLMTSAENKVELARGNLKRAQDAFGNIKGMKKTEAA